MQSYAEGWKEGTWEEKIDERPCIDALLYAPDKHEYYRCGAGGPGARPQPGDRGWDSAQGVTARGCGRAGPRPGVWEGCSVGAALEAPVDQAAEWWGSGNPDGQQRRRGAAAVFELRHRPGSALVPRARARPLVPPGQGPPVPSASFLPVCVRGSCLPEGGFGVMKKREL